MRRPISRPTILRATTLERPGRAAGPDDHETEHRAMSDPMLSETDERRCPYCRYQRIVTCTKLKPDNCQPARRTPSFRSR